MKRKENMISDTEKLPTMKIVEDCGVGLEGSTSATRLLRREILGERSLHMSPRSCITANTNFLIHPHAILDFFRCRRAVVARPQGHGAD
jgi:hypothetical protein